MGNLSDSERNAMLSEARLWATFAPHILPLIERRKKSAFERLMAKYASGTHDYVTLIAELRVLTDLENEIKGKENSIKMLEEKK